MARWRHAGGFSLEAAVRIEAEDRAGRERLLRYCARPAFALERLEQVREQEFVYRLPRPQPDGTTQLRLTPLELIDRGRRSYPARGPAWSGDRRQSECGLPPTRQGLHSTMS